MNVDGLAFAIAGVLILASLVLSEMHSVYCLWFAAFVGANMLQASFTDFCPLALILKKLGKPAGCAFQ